jgi:hypothetical protein
MNADVGHSSAPAASMALTAWSRTSIEQVASPEPWTLKLVKESAPAERRGASAVPCNTRLGVSKMRYCPRRELNFRKSSTDASTSDLRMETLSTLMPIGRCFSRA